jgi:SpoVK/Ycf46/Vps4 family AAA+-type ATPase
MLLQVVNGPEVLSKYVGQAEENIRNLFGEAEAEYKEKGDASVSFDDRLAWLGTRCFALRNGMCSTAQCCLA